MSISAISNGELGSSVRTKLNLAIAEANKVEGKLDDVGASNLRSDLTGVVSLSGTTVDWSAGAIFTKTLSGNTTLTFSNLVLNKVITLLISGNYALELPPSVKLNSGEYDGLVTNYIQVHCVDTSTPVFWGSISQEA